MNLKQFLKPDWRKIVIFVILSILIILFMPVGKGYLFVDCIPMVPCPGGGPIFTSLSAEIINQIFIGLSIFYENPHYNIEKNLKNFASKYLFGIIIESIIAIIISYILSCLTVWIYDKLRKVKK
jgi:hypothetical protein